MMYLLSLYMCNKMLETNDSVRINLAPAVFLDFVGILMTGCVLVAYFSHAV